MESLMALTKSEVLASLEQIDPDAAVLIPALDRAHDPVALPDDDDSAERARCQGA